MIDELAVRRTFNYISSIELSYPRQFSSISIKVDLFFAVPFTPRL